MSKSPSVPTMPDASSGEEVAAEFGSVPKKSITPPEKELILPIGFWDEKEARFYKGFEITGLSSDILTSLEDEKANPFKLFGMMVAHGLVKIFDHETYEEAPAWRAKSSKLFWQDVFFLMLEIIVKTKGSSFVPTAYKCPKCQKFTFFELSPDDENEEKGEEDDGYDLGETSETRSSLLQEDLRKLSFGEFTGGHPLVEFTFKEGVTLNGVTYHKYVFRIPEIQDYIIAFPKAQSKTKAAEKIALTSCIMEIDGIMGKELIKLKSMFGSKLLSLSLKEYTQIVNKLDSFGHQINRHKTICSACSYEYETRFDITNFFDSISGGKSM